MMENYDRTMELVNTAYNSAGRSSEQFAKYQDTLEYKLKQLYNTWEQFRTGFFNSEFFKGIIDGLNDILSKITELSGGKLVALGAAIITLGKVFVTSLIPSVQRGMTNLQKVITTGISKALGQSTREARQLKIEVDIRREKIELLKKELAQLEADKVELDLNDDKVIQDLEKIEQKIKELNGTISFDKAAADLGINKEDAAKAKERKDLNTKIGKITDELIDEDAIYGDKQKQLQKAQTRGAELGTVFATALSTAMITVTTTDNPITAVFSVLGTTVLSLLPGLISEIVTAVKVGGKSIKAAFLSSTGAIGIIISAIVAATAGATVLIKNIAKNAGIDELNKQIEESDKRIEDLKEKQKELESAANESKEAAKSAKELKDEFTELNQKQVLTAEEQTHYNELVQQIQSEYPEIVGYYNEITGELQVQNQLWESIIDSANQLAKTDARRAYSASIALSNEELNNIDLKAERDLKKIGFDSTDNIYDRGTMALRDQAQSYYQQYTDRDRAAEYFYKDLDEGFFRTAIDDAYKIRFGEDANINDDEFIENLNSLMDEFITSDKLINDLNEKYQEQRRAINDETEARKELIKQQNAVALAQSLATTTGADISVTNLVAQMQENQADFANKEAYLQSTGNKYNREFFAAELNGGIKGSTGEFTGNNLVSWDKMNAEIQETLKEAGMTSEEYNDLRKGKTGIEEIYTVYTDQLYANAMQELGEENIAKLTPQQEEQIKEFAANATNYTREQIDEFIKTESILPDGYAEQLAKEQIEAWEVASEQLQGWLGSDNFNQSYYEDWTAQQLQLFNTSIEKVPASVREDYAAAMSNFFGNNQLTAEQASTLLSIDPSTLDILSLETTKETYIENLQEMGKTTKEAEQIWEDYVDTIANYGTNLAITNEFGVDGFIAKVEELRNTAIEAWDAISKAQEEYFEKGELSLDSIQSLIEAGYGDYLTESIDGMVIDQTDLMNAYFDSITKGGEALAAQIEQNEAIYQANLLRKTNLENDIKKLVDKQKDGTISDEEIANLNEFNAKLIEMNALLEGTAKATDALKGKLDFQDMLDVLAVKEAIEDFTQSVEKSEEDTTSAKEKYDDLNSKLADLEKSYNEANKKLKEAQEGTDDYRSSIDELINYERRLERFNNELERSKDILSDVGSIDDARKLLGNITSLYENKMATLQAESKVLNQSLENIDKEIFANYSDFVKIDDFGNMNVNFNALESAKMSDILKDEGFTELFNKRNEVYDEIITKDKEYLDAQKEFEEMRSQFRDSQIKMENTVIDIIKDQMKQEVDAVTEKYAALEEADNDYLDALEDAIEKQRELREQQNQYDDLATKEKRLSLLQRDTSGANRKEVLTLENEIQDDRKELLDNEVDNLIESMKELYEKQKEARELEIEAMEDAVENMQLINETAMTIISGFSTAEDYQAWLLENDPSTQNMTVTQTEAYLDEAKETFAGYAEYVAFSLDNFTLKTEAINQESDILLNNISENATSAAASIQNSAETAASEAVTAAKDAVDEAEKEWNRGKADAENAYADWQEAEKNLEKSRTDNIAATQEALQKLADMAKVESIAAAQTAVNTMLDLGVTADELINKYEMDEQFVKDTLNGKVALTNASGNDPSKIIPYNRFDLNRDGIVNSDDRISYNKFDLNRDGIVNSEDVENNFNQNSVASLNEAFPLLSNSQNKVSSYPPIATDTNANELYKMQHGTTVKYTTDSTIADFYKTSGYLVSIAKKTAGFGGFNTRWSEFSVYKKGGLVDYTGPAWVDGTKNKPEAFLNADDTQRIGEAAKILSDIPLLNSTSNAQNAVSTNIGDTSIEIHINVENLSSDYDVDRMIDRVKQDIIDVSKPTGTPVILRK